MIENLFHYVNINIIFPNVVLFEYVNRKILTHYNIVKSNDI